MVRNLKWKPLLVSLAIPLAVGGLAAWLTRDGMKAFAALAKPPLSPPPWLFSAAWTLLYVLMGLACYLVWVSDASPARRERALTVYGVSLAVNFLWPILFFTVRARLAAFFLLLLLLALAALCALRFSCISRQAGRLLIPYLVWLVFAAYLNFGVWLLNK